LLALGSGVAWGSWRNLCADCPSVAEIRTWEPQQTSKIFSHDGRLVAEFGIERRTPVSIDALPEHVPQAVVAVEDKRFFTHGGFDPIGFARAALGVITGRNRGGGSTITQQLARNMFDEQIGFDRRYLRKLKELQVALELERSYTKEQILEAYLNEIYMGRVGYGFQSASRGFLGKDVTEVNPAEAALLAAILNVPARYDPFRNPENARRRRDLVLDRMAAEDYLTRADAERWKEFPLPTPAQVEASSRGVAPYFEEWVRQLLDSRYGSQVYRGGLRVTTTLDVDMQRAAREAMEWGWDRVESQPNYRHPRYAEFDTVKSFPGQTPYLQGMFIALDPATGAVRAMVGGRDFEQSNFDRARLARRQAGSSFKPFVYAAAIASGIPASHIIMDTPVVLPQVSGDEWRPRNFGNEFQGPVTIREGLRRSINMVAIKLGVFEVGLETVAQTARRMGIHTEIERYPSTTIGAAEVIPLQLAEAYSAFATLGTKVRPVPILRVENAEGDLIWEPQPERTQVLDSLTARIMVDLLQDAANRGTGANIRAQGLGELPYEVPAAGKTGTTNDGTDTWFMGFTPNLLAGIWFGMDRPAPMARGTPQATGGLYAAPVWGRFMNHVYYGTGGEAENGGGILPIPEPWPIAQGLTTREVDDRTGKLWSRWCEGDPEEHRYVEYYIPGTEPTELCDESENRLFRIPGVGARPSARDGGGR
ncbi:MAG: PBP1A family penicillin-binding protein, partial [Gemmatimonadetes bacterium]|nr:PBP1A family penicillin-binding protein [Gemmatimonadota bacterium]